MSNTARSWLTWLATSLWTAPLISGLLCALVVIHSLPHGSFVTGGDAFTPELDPQNALQRFGSAWNDRAGFGADDSIARSILFPIIIVDLALSWLRIPPLFINHFWLILAAAAQGYFTARLFLELFRDQTKTTIVPIFVGLASLVNPYTLIEWHSQYPPTLLSIAFFPGSLATLIAYYRRSQASYLLAFLFIALTVAVGNYNEPTAAVEAVLLIITTGALLIFERGSGHVLRGLQLLIVFFGVNLIWWIPIINFMFQSLQTVIGQVDTFSNAALLAVSHSSFLSNAVRLIGENRSFHWYGHSLFLPEGPSYESNVGLILATIVFPLLAYSALLLKRKSALVWTILIVTLIALFFAKGIAWPGGGLFRLLFDHFPIFRIFRGSFNKFEWVVAFGYALLAGVTLNEIFRLGSRKASISTTVIAYSALCVAAYPMLLGHLFWTDNIVRVPRQYFAMSTWLAKKSDLRVLNMPISYVNWDAYRWGYVGTSVSSNLLYNPLVAGVYDGAPAAPGNNEIDEAFREFPISIGLRQAAYVLGLYGVGYVVDDPSVDLTYYGPYHSARMSEGIPNLPLAKSFGLLHVYRVDSRLINPKVYAASQAVTGAQNLLDEALACRILGGCKNAVFLEQRPSAALRTHMFTRILGRFRPQRLATTAQLIHPSPLQWMAPHRGASQTSTEVYFDGARVTGAGATPMLVFAGRPPVPIPITQKPVFVARGIALCSTPNGLSSTLLRLPLRPRTPYLLFLDYEDSGLESMVKISSTRDSVMWTLPSTRAPHSFARVIITTTRAQEPDPEARLFERGLTSGGCLRVATFIVSRLPSAVSHFFDSTRPIDALPLYYAMYGFPNPDLIFLGREQFDATQHKMRPAAFGLNGSRWTPIIAEPTARIVTNTHRHDETIVAVRDGQVDIVANFGRLVPNQSYSLDFNVAVQAGTAPQVVISDGQHLPLVNEILSVQSGRQQSVSFPLVLADADTIEVQLLLDYDDHKLSKVALGPPRLSSESLGFQAAALTPAPALAVPHIDLVQQSSTSYRIGVSQAPGQWLLVLNASFNPNWQIRTPPGVSAQHVKANLFENVWLVSGKGSYDLFVTYGGQRYVWLGLWVATVLCAIALASLLLSSRK